MFRYLSEEDSMLRLSSIFGIEISTYAKILKDVYEAITEALMRSYVKAPTVDDFKGIADEFSQKWDLPNCLGAISCKHIKLAPLFAGPRYSKGENHSISVVALCGANYCFTIAEVSYLGSTADSASVFKQSTLGKAILDKTLATPPPSTLPNSDQTCNYFVVGDEKYSLDENLLAPFGEESLNVEDEKLRLERRILNFRLSRARCVVDNAFGVLATRWRRLHRQLSVDPDTAVLLVKACICLHNYVMKTRISARNGMGTYGDLYGAKDKFTRVGRWRWDTSPFVDTLIKGDGDPSLGAQDQRDVLSKYLTYENTLDYQVDQVNALTDTRAKKKKMV